MHNYDDEIYAYLTQPANYRSAKQIAGQLSMVDERLITAFWQEVKAELQRLLLESNWQVDLLPGVWFSVHRPAWKHMGVNCDSLRAQPDFGFHCNPDFYKRVRVDELLDQANVRGNEALTKSTAQWPCYRSLTEFDFRQQRTLERILPVPGYREEAVKSLVALFVNFVTNYGAVLDRIYEEALKSDNQ